MSKKKGFWAQAQDIQIAKREAQALASTPASLEWVTIEATGKKEAALLKSRGWEVVRDNRFEGGVYKAWVRVTVLRKARLDMLKHEVVR